MSLSVVLAFFPSDKTENTQFKAIIHDVGLSLKFEAKNLKVVDYSKQDGRSWEFSEKVFELIGNYKRVFPDLFGLLDGTGDAIAKTAGLLPGRDPDSRVKEIRT